MPRLRNWLLSLSAVSMFVAGPAIGDEGDAPAETTPAATTAPSDAAAPATPAEDKDAGLWSDFNHYVRVARYDLAQAAGTALLNSVDEQKLLDIVESGDYPDWEQTIERASRVETLKDLSKQLADKIQHARLARAADPKRITADIQKLGEGERANMNATARLKGAGQLAAPWLLKTLLDEKEARMHPYAMAAMVSIGRPMVYPLSVALPDLDPVPQGQVAQVLAEIGYPRSLPSLKAVMENPKADRTAKQMVAAAFEQIAMATGVPHDASAAELFLTLGQNHYRSATRGPAPAGSDTAEGKNLVWTYDRQAGLLWTEVPPQIYGDVLAMRAAKQALSLNPQMDQALSLWLAANLRRENRLKTGKDPSYPVQLLAPSFYLKMAGPLREHDVLARALDDDDSELALDAITALSATAGTDALVNRTGTAQPLLRALTYPDRRVRFNAAFAMSNARPRSEFPGSHRVVPVLAEALRQTDNRSAIVVGRDRDSANKLVATLKEMGFQAAGGVSLDELSEFVNSSPGIDLIVTNMDVEPIVEMHRQTVNDYKLASVPTIAIVSPGDQIELNHRFGGDTWVRTVVQSEKLEELKGAVDQVAKTATGAAIGAEEAQGFALTSLKLLHDIALSQSKVFNVTDAQPSLIGALADKREPVVTAVGEVLAMIEDPQAQSAIADAAMDTTRTPAVQISLLGSLANSATLIGNHLNDIQTAKLLDLVTTSQGDMAQAAARAHGALTLPTADVVPLIVK